MNKITLYKTIIFTLALCSIFVFPLSVIANPADDTNHKTDINLDASQESYMFHEYKKNKGYDTYKGEDIILDASNAKSPNNIIKLDDNSVVIKSSEIDEKSGDWLEWEVDINEKAAYYLSIEYIAGEMKGNPTIALMLDNQYPYKELESYALNRIFKEVEQVTKDSFGNDLIPKQEEIKRKQQVKLIDYSVSGDSDLFVNLNQGKHKIRLECKQSSAIIYSLRLIALEKIETVSQVKKDWQDKKVKEVEPFELKIQAENTYEKSDESLFPQYDRTSPATQPYHPTKVRRNIIGGANWSQKNKWISYVIEDIPEDGLYYLTIKYRQKDAIDVTTFRDIYVNGKIQSNAYESAGFKYTINWQMQTISDENSKPCPLYLNKGKNTLTFNIGNSKYAQVLDIVNKSCVELNKLYTEIIMITGTNPDIYRDYNLGREIPGLVDMFLQQSENLKQAAEMFNQVSLEKSSESETILNMARRLEDLANSPNNIHKRISDYKSGISSLYSWIDKMTDQPLEMDYFIIHSKDYKLPSPKASFFDRAKHSIKVFVNSFIKDYNSETADSNKQITVWANIGRDQVQVLHNLILDSFSVKNNTQVNLSIVQTGMVEATLAGFGPDVAIGVGRGQPINLAARNALLDFDSYKNFSDVKNRFDKSAFIPYQYNNKTYAIPFTQTFFMMFYRKDILQQLDIELPKTWDEFYKVIPKLQRNNMSVGLPYTVVSASAAVDIGLGAKDLYGTLLLQNGGRFYNDAHTKALLDSEPAMEAFSLWCELYSKYGLDLVYDFYTRFKTGEMPIGIANLEMFNTLSIAASEINGLWDMSPIPGTITNDDSINNVQTGTGTASIIFKKTKNPDVCYEFVDWWSSNDIQTTFCKTLENLLGIGGRYSTANLEAFDNIPWTTSQLQLLKKQRKNVIEQPEIVGSYYVSRSVDNAFRSVIYDKENPREMLEKENRNINREIVRKQREFDINN